MDDMFKYLPVYLRGPEDLDIDRLAQKAAHALQYSTGYYFDTEGCPAEYSVFLSNNFVKIYQRVLEMQALEDLS